MPKHQSQLIFTRQEERLRVLTTRAFFSPGNFSSLPFQGSSCFHFRHISFKEVEVCWLSGGVCWPGRRAPGWGAAFLTDRSSRCHRFTGLPTDYKYSGKIYIERMCIRPPDLFPILGLFFLPWMTLKFMRLGLGEIAHESHVAPKQEDLRNPLLFCVLRNS